MSKASTVRDQLWKRAQQEIAATLATLKTRTAAELRQLIASPQESEVREGRLIAAITAWAREDSAGRLGVVVEARQARWGGLFHSVFAEGFYIHSDATLEPMKEEDLWDHGY